MSPVVLDFECTENFIVRKLGAFLGFDDMANLHWVDKASTFCLYFLRVIRYCNFYKNGQPVRYSFLHLNKFKPTLQSAWCKKHLHGKNGNSGYEIYRALKNGKKLQKRSFLHKGFKRM